MMNSLGKSEHMPNRWRMKLSLSGKVAENNAQLGGYRAMSSSVGLNKSNSPTNPLRTVFPSPELTLASNPGEHSSGAPIIAGAMACKINSLLHCQFQSNIDTTAVNLNP